MKYRLMILLFYSLSSYGFDKFDAAVCDAGVDDPARVLCYRNAGVFSECQTNDATAELSCYKDKINLVELEKKEDCPTTTEGRLQLTDNNKRLKCYAAGDGAYIAPKDYSSDVVKLLQDKQKSANEKPATKTGSLPSEIVKLESDMVAINGGCFMMGTKGKDHSEKQHEVCVKDFEIGKYEVTQAQWQAVMTNNPSYFKGDNSPVERVSYNDVQDFIKKLNAQTGKTYRLPTEAEWEYAARAGTTTEFYTGDSINTEQANYDDTCIPVLCGEKQGGGYKKTTVTVGSYPANPWGLYDMAGNVYEWTCSAYDEIYDGSEKQCESDSDLSVHRGDSRYNVTPQLEFRHVPNRVLRGGAWNYALYYLRSASRISSYPPDDTRLHYIGFRLSRS